MARSHGTALVLSTLLACTGSASGDGSTTTSHDGTSDASPSSTATDAKTTTDTTDTSTTADSTDADSSNDGDTSGCALVDVACEDQMILDLSLVDAVSEGAVESSADGDVWRTEVDARAGGLPGASTNPWVYIRFDDEGASRVDIDDFAALESDAWHIAAKRYSLRLNSGSGGPSCVTAAVVLDSDFESITERPGVLAQTEAFYDAACELIDDGMGLGAPGYALTPWWNYPGCVATTGTPFVIDLPDGRAIKWIVDSYYASGQAECNATGAMGSDAGRFVWRWAWLP